MLQRCLEGLRRGARIRAVASTMIRRAVALYPGWDGPALSIVGLEGPSQRLRELPRTKPATERPSASRTWLRKLGVSGRAIWGRRRDREHRFWFGEFGITCLASVDRSGDLLAYGYYEPRRIGPIVARSARLQFRSCTRSVKRWVTAPISPSSCDYRDKIVALQALLEVGFRIDHIGMYMASRTFGRFDRCIPSGGTLSSARSGQPRSPSTYYVRQPGTLP